MKSDCLIAVLSLSALTALAATKPDAPAGDNPYTSIVNRNVFGLVPIPPPPDPTSLVPVTPPPKITPNGIMNVFGKLEALYKVQLPGVAGQPPKEVSYSMGEGERQDEITVVKIDEQAATVTFDNHGQTQVLELAKASGGGGGVPAPSGGASGVPQVKPATATTSAAGSTTTIGFGGRFGRNKSAAAANPDASAAPAGATTGVGTAAATGQAKPAENLTYEEKIINMESQRAKMLDEGNPAAALIPGTPLTKQVTGEEDIPAPPAPGGK